MTTDPNELADEIMRFLEAHAKTAASFDPAYDEPAERYSSPDGCELHMVAERLRAGMVIDRDPWSEWGSGGYSPYSDAAAREWHDDLLSRIRQYRAQCAPPRGNPSR